MAVEMIGGPRFASRCSRPLSDASPAPRAGTLTALGKEHLPLARRLGFRRIATRYDKLARNYFSALCLVAAVAFWL